MRLQKRWAAEQMLDNNYINKRLGAHTNELIDPVSQAQGVKFPSICDTEDSCNKINLRNQQKMHHNEEINKKRV